MRRTGKTVAAVRMIMSGKKMSNTVLYILWKKLAGAEGSIFASSNIPIAAVYSRGNMHLQYRCREEKVRGAYMSRVFQAGEIELLAEEHPELKSELVLLKLQGDPENG